MIPRPRHANCHRNTYRASAAIVVGASELMGVDLDPRGAIDHVTHDDTGQVRPPARCGDLEHVVTAIVGERLQREPRCLDGGWSCTGDDLDGDRSGCRARSIMRSATNPT